MNEHDVEVLDRKIAYKGFFRVDLYILRHRLHAGGWSERFGREVLERGHSAAVLPYDPVRDTVVLVEQFRIGPLAAGRKPWTLEVVAGMIDEGESAEAVALREAVEESGCVVRDPIRICNYFASPGGSSETVTLFCGRIESSLAQGVHGRLDEFEDILVRVLPCDDALGLLERGEIDNAPTIIALQWLALNRPSLRENWGVPGLASG